MEGRFETRIFRMLPCVKAKWNLDFQMGGKQYSVEGSPAMYRPRAVVWTQDKKGWNDHLGRIHEKLMLRDFGKYHLAESFD